MKNTLVKTNIKHPRHAELGSASLGLMHREKILKRVQDDGVWVQDDDAWIQDDDNSKISILALHMFAKGNDNMENIA